MPDSYDESALREAVGPRAGYYLKRFSKIAASRNFRVATWNWPAFFFSIPWFAFRRMYGWAALNAVFTIAAAFVTSIAGAYPTNVIALWIGASVYIVVAFVLLPMYANTLYFQRLCAQLSRRTEHEPARGTRVRSTSDSALVLGGVAALFVACFSLLIVVAPAAYADFIVRSQMSEAISLMSSAKTPIAEYRADKHKWPDDLKQVTGNTSGKYTDRIEITSGAGAVSGPLMITATMKTNGINSSIAGKTVQLSSEDGKIWTCSRGAINGVENKYLPAACRS